MDYSIIIFGLIKISTYPALVSHPKRFLTVEHSRNISYMFKPSCQSNKMHRIRVNVDEFYNEIHAVHKLCCTIDYSTIKQFYNNIT